MPTYRQSLPRLALAGALILTLGACEVILAGIRLTGAGAPAPSPAALGAHDGGPGEWLEYTRQRIDYEHPPAAARGAPRNWQPRDQKRILVLRLSPKALAAAKAANGVRQDRRAFATCADADGWEALPGRPACEQCTVFLPTGDPEWPQDSEAHERAHCDLGRWHE